MGLDLDGVLALLGKVQGIAGLGVIVPVDGHRITVEEHGDLAGRQLVAVAVLGKDVEGHAGVALGDAILQRGLQRDDILPHRHLKGGGELTEGHGDGLLPHGFQQGGGERVYWSADRVEAPFLVTACTTRPAVFSVSPSV